MQLTFIRHASTTENENGILIDRNSDPLLSSIGYQQLDLLAEEILNNPLLEETDAVFYSPTYRTSITATIFDKVEPQDRYTMEGLHEMDLGNLSGKPYNYLSLMKIQFFGNSNSHGGESGNTFKKRVVSTYQTVLNIASICNYKQIVIVSHNGWLVALLKSYLGLVNRFKFKFKNCEVNSFSLHQDKYKTLLSWKPENTDLVQKITLQYKEGITYGN